MRKIALFVSIYIFVSLLSSCYAFLQADRLIYAGTIAKKQLPTIVVDTLHVEYQTEIDNDAHF